MSTTPLTPNRSCSGPGWRLALPSLEFQRSSVPDQPNTYLPQAFIDMVSSRSEFQGIEDGLYMAIEPGLAVSGHWGHGV